MKASGREDCGSRNAPSPEAPLIDLTNASQSEPELSPSDKAKTELKVVIKALTEKLEARDRAVQTVKHDIATLNSNVLSHGARIIFVKGHMVYVKNTLSDGDVLNHLKENERILEIKPNTGPSASQELPYHLNKEDVVPSSISTLGDYLSATIKKTRKLERQSKKDRKRTKSFSQS